jgi:hypothetical protein
MITTASRQDRENFLFNDTFFLSKKGELMFKHFMYKMLLNKKHKRRPQTNDQFREV